MSTQFGANISYGPDLPVTAQDGSLFYKTTSSPGYPTGLYLFGLVADGNSGMFGSQPERRWQTTASGGVNADTLDGLDSTDFQLADSDLTAIANLSSNGFIVRTGAGSANTRSIVAGSTKISVSNGDGQSGNPSIDLNEANVTLSNLGGVLQVSKGGTGLTTLTAFGVTYAASTSTMAITAAGSNGFLLKANSAAAPTWADPASLTVGNATNAVNATTAGTASTANTLTTARTIAISGGATGTATSFNGSANITIPVTALDATTLTGVIANARLSGTYTSASIGGSAGSAAKWTTARTLSLTGDVSGSVSMDGSADVSITAVVANDSHTHSTYALKTGDTFTGAVKVAISATGQTANASADDFVIDRGSSNGGMSILSANTATGYIMFGDTDLNTVGRISYNHASNTLSFFTNNATAGYFNSTADFVSNGNVTAYSDIRLKKDIHVIENALQKVNSLHGVTFTRTKDERQSTGLIAQEVQAVLPQAVIEDDEGYLSVAYGNLVGLLVEALKEQQAQINDLRSELKGLKTA